MGFLKGFILRSDAFSDATLGIQAAVILFPNFSISAIERTMIFRNIKLEVMIPYLLALVIDVFDYGLVLRDGVVSAGRESSIPGLRLSESSPFIS